MPADEVRRGGEAGVIACRGGDYDAVDPFRIRLESLDEVFRRLDRHLRGRFPLGDGAGPDPGMGGNPLIARVDDRGEFIIGHDPRGKV